MKAYQHSAFFIHTYIKDFKLSKRYVGKHPFETPE